MLPALLSSVDIRTSKPGENFYKNLSQTEDMPEARSQQTENNASKNNSL